MAAYGTPSPYKPSPTTMPMPVLSMAWRMR